MPARNYQDIKDAINRLRNNDLEGARKALAAARSKSPKLAPPQVLMGNALTALNQNKSARLEYESAAKQFPADPESYLRMAELYAREENYTAAAMFYNRSLEVADKFEESPKRKKMVQARALNAGAAIEEVAERWGPAAERLQVLVKIDPDNLGARQRLAKALFRSGKKEDAYKELQAASRDDPRSLSAEITMAALYKSVGDMKTAEKWVARAEKKAEKNFGSQYGLASWYHENNDMEKAQRYADVALEIEPTSVEARVLRGMAARGLGDLNTAERVLSEAHLLAPTNGDAINQLALALIDKPDQPSHIRGLQFADLNSRLNPGNPFVTGTLAAGFYRAGKIADADRLFEAVSQRGTASTDTLYYLAMLRKEQGRLGDAEKALAAALAREGAFYHRKDAQELMAKLSTGSADAAGAADKKPK